MSKQSQSRRRFLKAAGAVGVAATAFRSSSFGYVANETVHVGGIGCGGRFRHLAASFPKISGVKFNAICDVWDQSISESKKLADPNAFVTKNLHELLARKDVDAVVICTPDHWHVPATVAACEAGKDVYVEKPLTHNLEEGQSVIDAQNKHRRIVQVGMQQRSMPQLEKANELIRSGAIGKVHKVHLTWNRNIKRDVKRKFEVDPKTVDWKMFLGNAKDQPFDPFRFRHWRWIWDFGGGILTDLMVHFIDVANWFLDLQQPARAVTIGDNFQTKGLWETPDTVQTVLQYPEKDVQVYFEGTFVNARSAAMLEFMGTEATLYADRCRYEIHPEPNSKVKFSELVLDPGKPRGQDFYGKPDGELLHLTNWVECIRNRKTPNAPAEAGVTACLSAHLANRAFLSSGVANWK